MPRRGRRRSPGSPRRTRACSSLQDRVDLVGHQTVRLAVHGVRGVGVRRLDQAEDLAALLIHPVVEVAHPVTVLDAEVGRVSPCDVGRARAVRQVVVNIHVQRHPSHLLSATTLGGRPFRDRSARPAGRGRCSPVRFRAVRTIAIQLLGRFSAAVDGVPISGDAWRSRRAADVVKLLALAPAHRMHRLEVMEALWPESDPEASGTNLRKALHFARLATGDEHAIVNERGVLVLWPDATVETDVERFDATVHSALDAGDAAACRAAAELYGGDLLPDDPYESWLFEPRGRLRRRYLEV